MRGQILEAVLGPRCEETQLHEMTCAHCQKHECWFEEKPKRKEIQE